MAISSSLQRSKLFLLVILCSTRSLMGELATITVDVATKSVSPSNPTVNLAANDAVLLRVVWNEKPLPSNAVVKTTLAGPRALLPVSDGIYRYADEHPWAEGASPLVIFRQCDFRARQDHRLVTPEPGGEFPLPRCPIYTMDKSRRAWTVILNEGIVLVRVELDGVIDPPASAPRHEEHAFAIQIVHRGYALNWSAGFSFLGLRDEKYRLDPIPGDDEHVTLVRSGVGEVPYQIAAFAHYTRLARRTQALSFSFGLATRIPVNELTAMVGGTLSLRTLPLVDAGHLTAGVAYGPREELLPDYRGRAIITAGVSPASLTGSRYTFGPFVAITFSFFGGEEQFKGVYSGSDTPQQE